MKKSIFMIISAAIFIFTYNTAHSAIVVDSVRGDVAVKEGRQWKPIKAGQNLKEGTKISTGVRSSAIIKLDGNILKIRQLTMMKIYRNRKIKNRQRTHLGLKFGSLNARVKRIGRIKTNFKISTPVATSSVRGTWWDIYNGFKGMRIDVLSGSVSGENESGVSTIVSGKGHFRMGPKDARPGGMLDAAHNSSLGPLFDPNNQDERQTHGFINDDIGGSGDSGGVGNLDMFTQGGNSSSVNVEVTWP